jgi:hypothetical protein
MPIKEQQDASARAWGQRARTRGRVGATPRESAPSLEPIVRWGLPFYVKDGKDVCYIKPDKDFIAFGFGEVVNPAREEGASMHPVAWTLTSLDDAAEAKIRALIKKAVA